jgi:hypothetical protein
VLGHRGRHVRSVPRDRRLPVRRVEGATAARGRETTLQGSQEPNDPHLTIVLRATAGDNRSGSAARADTQRNGHRVLTRRRGMTRSRSSPTDVDQPTPIAATPYSHLPSTLTAYARSPVAGANAVATRTPRAATGMGRSVGGVAGGRVVATTAEARARGRRSSRGQTPFSCPAAADGVLVPFPVSLGCRYEVSRDSRLPGGVSRRVSIRRARMILMSRSYSRRWPATTEPRPSPGASDETRRAVHFSSPTSPLPPLAAPPT